MKKFITIVAIVAVLVVGFMVVRGLFAGDGNATFMSYAPGGKNMAYITVDSVSGVYPAHAEQTGFTNGDRVQVKMGNDGFYTITGGPY